jgi:hypothetical protein
MPSNPWGAGRDDGPVAYGCKRLSNQDRLDLARLFTASRFFILASVASR